MGIKERIIKAQTTEWITEGFSKTEIKSIKDLAKISAKIEMKRNDLGMTQKEFARFMGVSQGMVSKWESREYNFTITSLNDICDRIGLVFEPVISEPEEIFFGQITIQKKNNQEIKKINKYIKDYLPDQSRGIA